MTTISITHNGQTLHATKGHQGFWELQEMDRMEPHVEAMWVDGMTRVATEALATMLEILDLNEDGEPLAAFRR